MVKNTAHFPSDPISAAAAVYQIRNYKNVRKSLTRNIGLQAIYSTATADPIFVAKLNGGDSKLMG